VEQTHKLQGKQPFFWIHESTGGVYCYIDLVKHLRHDRPFYGFQAPGLVGVVPCADPVPGTAPTPTLFTSIEEMATFYIGALLAIQPEGPYFLGGYSFGGYVAFEMARQLQAQGCSVAFLAILDSYPREQDSSASASAGTGTCAPTTVKDYTQPMMRMAELLERYWRNKVSVSYSDLCCLQPDEQLAYFLDCLKGAQVVPDDMDVAQLRRFMQVDEAHSYCFRRYRPKHYSGRITLFRSEDGKNDPSLWAPFSSEPAEVHPVPGDHILMVVEPHVKSLAVQLQRCLDNASFKPHDDP
jgi:thioesterase domain-containing protein